MDTCRLQARDWLSQSTRKEFEAIISEAKLTPRQIEIIELKFIHDLKNYQIAMKIDTSVQTVERGLIASLKTIDITSFVALWSQFWSHSLFFLLKKVYYMSVKSWHCMSVHFKCCVCVSVSKTP